jgi:hypothetical protein
MTPVHIEESRRRVAHHPVQCLEQVRRVLVLKKPDFKNAVGIVRVFIMWLAVGMIVGKIIALLIVK